MTNEEKAKDIARNKGNIYSDYGKLINPVTHNSDTYDAAVEMAEWKDQQFKEHLEKKKTQYSQAITTFDVMRKKVIDEIINELFGE